MMPRQSESAAIRRVMEKVRVDLDTGCWVFEGARHRNGYGAVRWNGRLYKTHRLMFTLLRGEVQQGLDLDHLCHVRACCNPFHMEPVTRSENVLRALEVAA